MLEVNGTKACALRLRPSRRPFMSEASLLEEDGGLADFTPSKLVPHFSSRGHRATTATQMGELNRSVGRPP